MNPILRIIKSVSRLYSGEGGGYEALAQEGEVASALTEHAGTTYIANALSLNMIADDAIITKVEVSAAAVKAAVANGAISVIGHADTAAVVSSELGIEVPCNRVSLSLTDGDCVYVAQYIGPRLPEGATTLPEGSTIKYFRCIVRTGKTE